MTFTIILCVVLFFIIAMLDNIKDEYLASIYVTMACICAVCIEIVYLFFHLNTYQEKSKWQQ